MLAREKSPALIESLGFVIAVLVTVLLVCLSLYLRGVYVVYIYFPLSQIHDDILRQRKTKIKLV